MVSRFRRFYQDPTLWQSRRYRTRDRAIPFGLFWIHYRAMGSVNAFERVQMARAIASGISIALSKPGSGIPESVRDELRDAYLSEG